jgi:two-component system, NarL family, nitrate/nitrite response regulator NarL
MFRSGVRNLLAREGDFELSEAANFEELERAIESEQPDIALIDLNLPPAGGIGAVSLLAGRCETRLIVWSLDPSDATVLAAISAGAGGYVDKDISSSGLVRSLRGALRGEAPLSRRQTAELVEALHGVEERYRARERAVVLSRREREVLALVAAGARNRQIAEELEISEFTVKRHMQNILTKLQLSSRVAAGLFYVSAFGNEYASAVVGAEA